MKKFEIDIIIQNVRLRELNHSLFRVLDAFQKQKHAWIMHAQDVYFLKLYSDISTFLKNLI